MLDRAVDFPFFNGAQLVYTRNIAHKKLTNSTLLTLQPGALNHSSHKPFSVQAKGEKDSIICSSGK